MPTVAVSLKSYLGAARTREWSAAVAGLAREESGVRMIVLPAFPLIPDTLRALAGTAVEVGAQDLNADASGAITGGVSGALLAELGCRVAEMGHAERRRLFGETDATVAAKLVQAVDNGLTPLLCVGEEEQGTPAQAASRVADELRRILGLARSAAPARLLVAYEPHWAIGRTEPAPAAHIVAVARALRAILAADPGFDGEVLYGGSAGPGMLARLAPEVDGLFLGRSAHDPAALAAVLNEASMVNDRS